MRMNYKLFMKHAEKMVKGMSGTRPALKGVHHDDKGTVTVTDSYRLYKAYKLNAPTNTLIDAVTGDEMDLSYPDTNRLIPDKNDARAVLKTNHIKELKETLKAMRMIGRAFGFKKEDILVTLKDGKLSLDTSQKDYKDIPAVSFQLDNENKGEEYDMLLSLEYMIEALEFLDDCKADEVVFYFFSNMKPLLITPAPILDIIILPRRRF